MRVSEKNQCVLAVDCGTSSIKYALVARNGEILLTSHVAAPPAPARHGDAQEWDPIATVGRLAKAVFLGAVQGLERRVTISGIALTTTTSSLVAVRGYQPLAEPPAIRWDDLQCREEACELERWRKGTGAFPWLDPVMADAGIAKGLFWVKRYPHSLFDQETHVMEQLTFLNWWLTDEISQVETIVSRKWGQTRSRRWPDAFRERLKNGIARHAGTRVSSDWFVGKMLPGNIVPAGEKIGKVRKLLADMLNLPMTAEVFAAPLDTFAQIMGLGLVEPSSMVGVSLGTSLGVCQVIPETEQVRWSRFGPVPACPVPGTMLLFDGVASCGAAIGHVCRSYGVWKDEQPDYGFIQTTLAEAEPGARGITILPYFAGGRRTTIARTVAGRFDGITTATDRRHIIQALFESLAYLVRLIVDDFAEVMSAEVTGIKASGGLTLSPAFMQMLADVTKREIQVCSYSDTALLGASICALRGLGWHRSFKDAADAISRHGRKRTRARAPFADQAVRFIPFKPRGSVSETYEVFYRRYLRRYGRAILHYGPRKDVRLARH